jgi:hypothetical protein
VCTYETEQEEYRVHIEESQFAGRTCFKFRGQLEYRFTIIDALATVNGDNLKADTFPRTEFV